MSHIRWAFNLHGWRPSKQDLLLATACIQPEEKERLAKFVYRNDFDASLIGRLLMRKFVHQASGGGLAYDRVRFCRDLRGKPYWDSSIMDNYAAHVDFNVSHQGSYSVLAGFVAPQESPPNAIGVDIMKIEYTGGKPLHEFFRIMTSNFSASEWRTIKGYGAEKERLAAFMRHWCLKESYVKNVGVGITVDLKAISFQIKGELNGDAPRTDTQVEVQGELLDNWQFHEYLLDAEHIVAVSLRQGHHTQQVPAIPEFKVIDFKELMCEATALTDFDETYCEQVMSKEYK